MELAYKLYSAERGEQRIDRPTEYILHVPPCGGGNSPLYRPADPPTRHPFRQEEADDMGFQRQPDADASGADAGAAPAAPATGADPSADAPPAPPAVGEVGSGEAAPAGN